jgi:hypothetical protein
MATQWGRKETIIWPPHVPLMSYCSIAGALLLTVFFAWEHYAFQLAPLQKAYLTDYVCADIGSAFHAHQSYRLLYLGGGNAKPRAAMPVDFAEGTMSLPNGKHMRFALSDLATSQGYRFPFRGPVEKLADGSMYRCCMMQFMTARVPGRISASAFSKAAAASSCCSSGLFQEISDGSKNSNMAASCVVPGCLIQTNSIKRRRETDLDSRPPNPTR